MRKEWNSPTYSKQVPLPRHLNLPISLLVSMEESKYKKLIEEVRCHLLKLVENNHSPFGGKLNESEIIRQLKILNHEIGTKFIPPPDCLNYFFGQENDYADGLLKYNTSHTNAINHWFYEIWETESSTGINPIDQIRDKDIFYRNLNAIIKKGKFKIFSNNPDTLLSKCIDPLRITNGSKPAYNFPSALAKWIYLETAQRLSSPDRDFYILDTSCGWGGRLGGALAVCNHPPLNNLLVHYFGTDVNSKTHENFFKLESYWKEHINPDIKFDFYKSLYPAEILTEDSVFKDLLGKFDISLTSPPYFNCEKYSKDTDQSYIKYPHYLKGGDNSWKNGFLKRMIKTNYDLLKEGGEFWLNIANVKNKNEIIPLENDSIKIAKEMGFKHILTYKMIKPNIYSIIDDRLKNATNVSKIQRENVLIHDEKEVRFEPIFVFKK